MGHSVRGEVKPVKKYELIFIMQADQPESEMELRVQRVRDILSQHEGEITQENHWGVRRLAYEINHENKGNYMFLKFRSQGTVVEGLDRFLRQDDKVLRHLVVVDDEWEERNRKARAKRKVSEQSEAPAVEQ
ncbi:30S ribosomal protein S6 [bacterium CG17_big_fil_post_rev_8_21_14_2_50_64_8]|nr:MAG: 30S ribosomal protein S6 [bacterium CG17_big_fil_post_rev_8_21_14_2_50_64_8]